MDPLFLVLGLQAMGATWQDYLVVTALLGLLTLLMWWYCAATTTSSRKRGSGKKRGKR